MIDIAEPGAGHKGGGINITDDGTLYLAVGDGGGSRGRDAQDMTKTLGAILRIVPSTTGPGYTVPDDNPFVGDSTKAPEIFAKGLRNPWGFWRDPVTDELWISDVGEDTVEELNRIPDTQTGANFGWYFVEGDHVRYQGAPADIVAPLFTYRHDADRPRHHRRAGLPGERDPGARRRLRVRRHGRPGDGDGRLGPGRHAHRQPAERGDHRLRHRPRRRALRAHPPRRPVQDRARLTRPVRRRAELAVAGVAEAGDDEGLVVEVVVDRRR